MAFEVSLVWLPGNAIRITLIDGGLMTPCPSHGQAAVRPVLLNSEVRAFLLCPSLDGSAWTVPRVPLRCGENCRTAALRYLRRYPSLPRLSISPLVGHHRVGTGPGALEYVVLFTAAPGSWDSAVQLPGRDARWWTLQELGDRQIDVEPASLPLFMDGYWEGWLPDGEISLD